MKKEDFKHYEEYRRHTKFNPCGFTEEGKLIATITRKLSNGKKGKIRNFTKLYLGSVICNQDTGKVEVIRFSKEAYEASKTNIWRVLACLLHVDLIVDDNTEEYLITHPAKRINGKWERNKEEQFYISKYREELMYLS